MLNKKKFRDIYDDYLASGLTVRDYCSNQGMNEAKFYYWQNKLKGILPPKKGFVPVVFENNQSLPGRHNTVRKLHRTSHGATSEGSSTPCEISYPNGVCLKLDSFPEVDVLRSLLLLMSAKDV